jgi:hypothetical protein
MDIMTALELGAQGLTLTERVRHRRLLEFRTKGNYVSDRCCYDVSWRESGEADVRNL